jgi:filamentous hemagglutinin family protein
MCKKLVQNNLTVAVVVWTTQISPTLAQSIIPDNTLGNEQSIVTQIDRLGARIDGGAIRGQNLFHSFEQFNIDLEQGAYFSSPSGIRNIISRVTGRDASTIRGSLGVLGGANLFLINPNGIFFGENSTLDISGSFIATTANALQFGTQGSFSTTMPSLPSLLTVNPSAFLFTQTSPGNIAIKPTTLSGLNISRGQNPNLRVANGQNLMLVGGDIDIAESHLIASGGHIEIGGLARSGNIAIDMTEAEFRLIFPTNSLLSNLSVSNDAQVNVLGSGNGSITVSADRFTMRSGGHLVGGTQGSQGSGDMQVNASSLRISGYGVDNRSSGIYQETSGTGNGGDIIVSVQRLVLDNGAMISNETGSEGRGGNLRIYATQGINLTGSFKLSPESRPVYTTLRTTGTSVGRGGNINLHTERLSIQDDARISTFSAQNSRAQGGRINIRATESVLMNNLAFIETGAGAAGESGDLILRTPLLSLINRSRILADTFGIGRAGSIQIFAPDLVSLSLDSTISTGVASGARVSSTLMDSGGSINLRTHRLVLDERSQINTTTEAQGNAGNIWVHGAERISLADQSSITAEVGKQARGRSGNITLSSDSLDLTDASSITTESNGRGRAGNILIDTSGQIQLTNSNLLTSANRSAGGAITINAEKIRLLGNSNVRTDVRIGGEDAGSIVLNSRNYVLALDDSDILAFANQQGGEITLNSPELFAENYSPAPPGTERTLDRNNQVDINANAQQPGNITIPDTSSVANSLTDLPDNSLNRDRLLANSCLNRTQQPGRFTITGTDGLPQRPGNANQSAYPTGTIQSIPQTESSAHRPWRMGDAIVEPQGVARLPDGRLAMEQGCNAPQ